MSEKEFLKQKDMLLNSIEQNTPEHWKNYYKDVPLNCIFDDLVIDINEIKRLTKENQELKEVFNELIEYMLDIDYKMGWQYVNYVEELLQQRGMEGLLKGDKQ